MGFQGTAVYPLPENLRKPLRDRFVSIDVIAEMLGQQERNGAAVPSPWLGRLRGGHDVAEPGKESEDVHRDDEQQQIPDGAPDH